MRLTGKTAFAARAFALIAALITSLQLALLARELISERVTHEPVVWAVTQAEFELIRLNRILYEARYEAAPDPNVARLRADLLWSRLDLMQQGRLGAQFARLDIDLAAAEALAVALDDFVAALPGAMLEETERNAWRTRFDATLAPIHALALETNQKNLALLAEESATNRLVFILATIAWLCVVVGGALLLRMLLRAGRQAEAAVAALNLSNARLYEAIEAIPSGFALFDPQDRLVLCNARYRDLYPELVDRLQPGARYEDIIAAGLERRIFGHPHAEHEASMEAALAVRARGDAVEQRLADRRWLLAADRRAGNGDTVAIRTDITRLKAQEAELLEARDRAEAASRAKSGFIATMSHEIRTPMNGVLGTLELLSTTKLADKQRMFVTVAEKSARSLLTLLDDLLDLSKIEAGRLEVEESDFPVQTLIESARDVFSAKAAEKRLDLSIEMGPDIPRFLRGDVGRLRQVLLNLVGNAVKFTDRGFVRIHAHIDADAGDDGVVMLVIAVEDTGVGVPDGQVEGLFQEFNQIDQSYARKYGGTGLGLAISRKLVELMGGEIGVASRLGEGSRFWCRLPLGRSTRRFEAAAAPAEIANARALRVLLVDDSEVNRMIAVEMLQKAGHEVDTGANGVEAVNMAQTRDYDLILMDVSMPQMDGREATTIIRSLGQTQATLPIIAMTAHTTDEDRRKCAEAGMTDFLSKPLTAQQLNAMVKSWSGRAAPIIPLPAAPDDEAGRTRPLLDLQTLSELEEDTSPEVIPVLLSAFRAELVEKLDLVERAILRGDAEAVAAAAHPLKSSAGAFGCFLMQELAAEVERLAREDRLEAVDGHLDQLKDVGVQTERAIIRYAESHPGDAA